MVVSPPHLTVSVHQEGEVVIRREHISVFQPCHIKKTNMIINSKQMLRNVFINFYLSSPISIGIGSACRLANQVHSEKTNLGKKNKVRERCDQLTPDQVIDHIALLRPGYTGSSGSGGFYGEQA